METIHMKNTNDNITLYEAFKEFYRIKRIHNVSEHTLDYYESEIKYFSYYYSVDNPCYLLTQEDIYRIHRLHETNFSCKRYNN